jgi:GLPGLI family protein
MKAIHFIPRYALFFTAALCLLSTTVRAQEPQRGKSKEREEAAQKMAKEKADYYANADTACYGVRYRFVYLCNKEKKQVYQEDRVVLVTPKLTLDMSFQSFGEHRWHMSHPDGKSVDGTLAYHLTPSYDFYYPESGRLVRTYRVLSDEFLRCDSIDRNEWTLSEESKQIGTFTCRKATCTRQGRTWTAWYTNDLPYVAAPRTLQGLNGVVLEASDADREIVWNFTGIEQSVEGDPLYLKFPDRFTSIPSDRLPQIAKIFALSDGHNYIQTSGVLEKQKSSYPEKYRPSTGIDAWEVDNPIER